MAENVTQSLVHFFYIAYYRILLLLEQSLSMAVEKLKSKQLTDTSREMK